MSPGARSAPGPGKADILEAAAAAFAGQGFAATTIDDIADQLGSTKGRVYHYYRSKAEIFLDVIQVAMEELLSGAQQIAALDDVPAAERLWRMVHLHAGLMMTRNSFQRVAVQGLEMRKISQAAGAADHEKVVGLRDRYEQTFVDVISEGIEDGSFRRMDARLITKPALGAINWITIWYDPERADAATIHRMASEHADFVVNGLRARP